MQMNRLGMVALLGLAVGWLAGCAGAPTDATTVAEYTPAVTAAPTSAVTLAPPSATTPSTTPTDTAVPSPTPFESTVLRVWMVSALAPRPDVAGGALLAEQLDQFAQTRGLPAIDAQAKTVSDAGGIFSYLRTGRDVAPNVLPDLILLPADQLPTAVRERFVYPLEETVALDGFYLAALALGQVNGRQFGYPAGFSELYHAVVNKSAFPDGPPPTWDELLLNERARLGLAANGRAGVALTLQLYRSGGGTLDTQGDRLVLQETVLAKALGRLQTLDAAGRLTPEAERQTTDAEAWNSYLQGNASLVVVNASFYLDARSQTRSSDFGLIPGNTESARPLATGYVWAVTTADPVRRPLAEALLAYLADPAQLGPWSAAARVLPTRPAAFAAWTDDPYHDFLRTALNLAEAYPLIFDAGRADIVRVGVVDLLEDNLSPGVPARQIVQALAP